MFKRLSSKVAGEGKTGGVASCYVEDFAEPRTTLESRFNIR
jgi:hypothetical protein